jgi:ATP-dependent DNA helicase RecG
MAELVDALLRRHEDKTLEFKLDLSSPDRVVASIVAFANAAGGVVLIGVEDNSRAVRGLPEPTEVEERLANLVSDRIAPSLLVDISIVPWRGHSLVMAEVYPSVRRPHHDRTLGVERGTFVRIGSSNRLADESLRAELARGTTETFDETPLASATAADIDADFAGRLLNREPLSEADLVALRAIDGRGDRRTATVGGYLLFRRDPEPRLMPDAWLHAGRFSSGDRTQIADSKRIDGRLTEIVDAGLSFLDRSLESAYRFTGQAAHYEVRPVPPSALREALVNAIVHADYRQQGAPIRVAVHPDRVEIDNPGLLLPGLTIEDLYAGTSRLRNRMIGRFFAELGYIEQWGSGIRRMVDECRAAGKPDPLIEELAGRVRVTFRFDEHAERRLGDRDRRLLELMEPDGVTSAGAAVELGVSDRTARKLLAALAGRGFAVAVGTSPNDPHRRYMATPQTRSETRHEL